MCVYYKQCACNSSSKAETEYFCDIDLLPLALSSQDNDIKTESGNKCAKDFHNLVTSHATNCQNETLNLARDKESGQMHSVVTLTQA